MKKSSPRLRTSTAPLPKRLRNSPTPRTTIKKNIQQLALTIGAVALDKKASRVEIIDVRGKVDYTDYVIVMSGRSDRQVAALARNIETELATKHHTKPISTEGLPQASWVLLDYGDVVVHIFHEDAREYYDLESLWMDAKRLEVS
jgi:ribosome-associated protein